MDKERKNNNNEYADYSFEHQETSSEQFESSASEIRSQANKEVESFNESGLVQAESIANEHEAEIDLQTQEKLSELAEEANNAQIDLVESTITKKTPEYIPGVSSESEVNNEIVENYNESNADGPIVGHGIVLSKETGESVNVAIRAITETRQFTSYDTVGEAVVFRIADAEENGHDIGHMVSREDTPDRYQKYEEVIQRKDHTAEEHYGDIEEERPTKVFIEMMSSKFSPGKGGRDYFIKGHDYKGVGKLLYEIAVEHSVQVGGGGKVQGQAAFQSMSYHEAFGMRGQDVHNRNTGELQCSGQQVHTDLAESWLQQGTQIQNEIATNKYIDKQGNRRTAEQPMDNKELEQAIKAQGVGKIYDEQDNAYIYLPKEVIQREQGRMKENPRLEVNRATFKALMRKHDQLESYDFAEGLRKTFTETGTKIVDAPTMDLEKLAKLYSKSNKVEAGTDAYLELAKRYSENAGEDYRSLDSAAEYFQLAGNLEKAKLLWDKAVQIAKKQEDNEAVERILVKSGMEETARSNFREY